jgi:DedD protein
VPQLSHETADDGFHEIQLSGKQLVFLFIVGTMAAVTIFLCGVYVGRGAPGARLEEAQAAAADAAPAPQPMAETGPPAAEPPTPPAEDELSYHKRLQGDAPPEDLKPPAADRSKPATSPAGASPAGAPPPAPASAQAPADVPAAGKTGAWVVQVVALQDRAVAAALVKRLNGKGYPAFLVVPSSASAPRIFKVQVGRYNDKREAEQVSRRLEKEEQFKPWISR